MALQRAGQLAAATSTGNNTHTSVAVSGDSGALAFKFDITAVGGTPTVTFKIQGTMDDNVVDASADWFDIAVIPADTTTPGTQVVTQTKTAVSVNMSFIPVHTFAKRIRLVTTANTNVTYEAELFESRAL